MLRNSKNSKSSEVFKAELLKNNRVTTSNIIVILKSEDNFYDSLFKRYFLRKQTN